MSSVRLSRSQTPDPATKRRVVVNNMRGRPTDKMTQYLRESHADQFVSVYKKDLGSETRTSFNIDPSTRLGQTYQ